MCARPPTVTVAIEQSTSAVRIPSRLLRTRSFENLGSAGACTTRGARLGESVVIFSVANRTGISRPRGHTAPVLSSPGQGEAVRGVADARLKRLIEDEQEVGA